MHPRTQLLRQLSVVHQPRAWRSERLVGKLIEAALHTYTAGQVFLEQPEPSRRRQQWRHARRLGGHLLNVPHSGSNRIERANPGNCPS